MPPTADTRAWLGRIATSLLAALGAGGLAFLIGRAVTGLLLLIRQRELLGQMAGAVRAGIDAPPSTDLRAARQLIAQIDARNMQICLAIGFVVAALAAVICYLWLERRAARRIAA